MSNSSHSPLSVLLLEDDPDDQLLFRELLEEPKQRPISLRAVDTCADAREVLHKEHIDVCFVDYRLGTESGLAFIRELAPKHPEIPFMLLTELDDEEVDEQALRAGAKDFLHKGRINSRALMRCIRYTLTQTRSEMMVRNQRRVVSGLLESLGEVLWIYDIHQGRFLEMGTGIRALSGHPPQAFLDNPTLWTELINPGFGESRDTLIRNAETGQLNEIEYLVTDKHGVEHRVHEQVRLMKNAEGDDWLVGILRDVTVEHETRTELQLLREVVHQVEDPVLVTSAQLDRPGGPPILYANPAFQKMTGYSAGELIGKPPGILQGPKTNRRVLDDMKEALRAGKDFSGEIINYRKDQTEYVVHWSITPVRGEDGEVKQYASVQRDVTEEVRQRRAQQRNQRLESLGNLVGGIAHDLNNILSPILMGAGMLEHADTPDMRKALSGSLVESAERGAEVVGKLLAFARGGSGEKRDISPADTLNAVYGIARETFPRNLNIHLKIRDALWTVHCSASEIQQALLNLAINAKDSMENQEEGSLALTGANLTLSRADATRLGLEREGPYVCISVKDTGHGMAQDIIDRIFDPFYTTKAEGKGTGLGLPSSLGIIRSHHGTIDVMSEPDKGSVFSIYLPAIPQRDPEHVSTDYTFQRGNNQRLLVVDDEPTITQLVCDMLEQYGYRAQGLTSSPEAVRFFASHADEIDGLITDMMMPQLDGVELCRRVRDIKPDLPIMVMTGYVRHEKLEEIEELGVSQVLPKPVRLETLMRNVNECFE